MELCGQNLLFFYHPKYMTIIKILFRYKNSSLLKGTLYVDKFKMHHA